MAFIFTFTTPTTKPDKVKKITLLALFLGGSVFSQIVNTAPYILTVDELKAWTQNGPTASADLVSDIPLAMRFTNSATQFNPALTNDMQIAYLPDGMNNFGNYHGEQSQFNLYNFTHWAYIDKLVWFGGTSSQTVQIPSSPWANAAHKNGVKIFGNVFFAPTAFGGSSATLQNFLEQDGTGNFLAIPKMIAIMQYYNFDGWFINQETATTATIAELMQDFVRDLTTQAEAVGKEVMWYDAMRLSGAVGWQNRLNQINSPFVQDDQDANGSFETRVSSSIFINFFWGSSSFPTMSRTRAQTIGRSPFEVFTGADIWPGRNQGNFETNGNAFMGYLHENVTTPYTSLGLFAPNCVYNNSTYTNFNTDPADYASFYAAENRMFAGMDSNPAIADATGWKGFGNWVPETSVITTDFDFNFNTGHGLKKFEGGTQISSGSWHNMNVQDILPTWQWAFSPGGILTAQWDFNDAWEGGSSLKISGDLPAGTPVDLMLYKTKLTIPANGATTIGTTLKTASPLDPKMKLLLVFADAPGQKYELALDNNVFQNGWSMRGHNLDAFAGRELAMIGLRFYSETAVPGYSANVGRLASLTLLGTEEQSREAHLVTVIYPGQHQIGFTINWPGAQKIDYSVFDVQGRKVKSGGIPANKTDYKLETAGLGSGVYSVKFTDENNTTVTKKIIVR